MIVLAYRCIVQILPPVGRQNDELYGVVIFPRKHESPPLPAGFFLSLSSLAIQGEIIGAMAPVFALWIVGVRRFLSLGGLTRFPVLPTHSHFCRSMRKQILRVAQDDMAEQDSRTRHSGLTAPLKPKEGLNGAPRLCYLKSLAFGPGCDARSGCDSDHGSSWYSWMRLPQVSEKMAMLTGPALVGPVVKTTPCDLRRSYSLWISVTSKAARGIFCANIAS
jgi:hypothetical protein